MVVGPAFGFRLKDGTTLVVELVVGVEVEEEEEGGVRVLENILC